jgi:hypothetical protein
MRSTDEKTMVERFILRKTMVKRAMCAKTFPAEKFLALPFFQKGSKTT